ncbi:MAG: hypothetical protein HY721_16155 [Planctomycetes bacterium]|nr:hypothetical protein [Planctomycetota bacterium]
MLTPDAFLGDGSAASVRHGLAHHLHRAAVLLLGGLGGCLVAGRGAAAEGELPLVEWELVLGGAENDLSNDVRQTPDGGYIVAARRMEEGDFDLELLRLGADGSVLWARALGGPREDVLRAVEPASDGGFIAAGRLAEEFLLLKTGASGEPEWQRTYGPGTAYSVVELPEGAFVGAGFTESHVLLVRTDASGAPEWERRLGGDGSETGFSLARALDGGFVVAGLTTSLGPTDSHNAYLLRTDPEGHMEWHAWFGGEGPDWSEGVVVTPEGDFVATGSSAEEMHLFKTDGSGMLLWERRLGSFESNALWRTADGGYVLGGLRRSPVYGDNEPRVARTDGEGLLLWSMPVLRPGETGWASSVQVTSDGGYIFAGSTRPRSTPYFDILVVKLGPERPPRRTFLRGDANGDGKVDVSDPVYILAWLFLGGPAPACEDAADADDGGQVNITDAIHALGFLFLGGQPPPPPHPAPGLDPTWDGLGC